MPTLSMFYGIIIQMFWNEHNPPHFHATYGDFKAIFDFDGNLKEGKMPGNQQKLIAAWTILHHDELLANWQLSEQQHELVRIAPLQ